jgi:sugar phosphate isomerase/epimerase
MPSRRSFIKSTSVLSAGYLVSPALLNQNKSFIGLQLYTVRDAMQSDPSGTLARVAQIGYNSLETATYTGTQKFYGMNPAAFSKTLKQNGLIAHSGHYRLGEEKINGEVQQGTIKRGWDKAVDDAAAVGIKYMVCAYLSDPERGNIDHYKRLAAEFNKAGATCKKAGIQFCYHNHDFEFVAKNGQLPYDILLNESDKNLVKMEMDMYWVKKAGLDPIALINKNPGRFPLWHTKDMDNTQAQAFAEVGSGIINFKQIFTRANKARSGLKYFFVEQDKCPGSPFDSITKSIRYIKQNLI